ncbi:hypothetical protein CLU79DRAFT_743831 [Phycomyces nitens]|nr:hypothetical protein CLU79DRAFT_743831 [Phycomyces nitens]
MILLFGMNKLDISAVCKGMEQLIYKQVKWSTQFDTHHFRPENLKRFSKAIYEKGASLPMIVGFIDGNMYENEEPKIDTKTKKSLYEGCKIFNSFNLHSIVTPDGITSSIMGPGDNSRNEIQIPTILTADKKLEKYLHFSPNFDDWYTLYGNTTSIISANIVQPFDSKDDFVYAAESNKRMEKVAVIVKWEFWNVENYFEYTMAKGTMAQKRAYVLSTIFKNMLHCVGRGESRTYDFFRLEPPSIQDYIAGLRRERIEGEDMDVSIFDIN